MLKHAAQCFSTANISEKAGDTFEKLGEHGQAAECFLRIGKYQKAGDLYMKANLFANALECFERQEDWEGLLICLNKNKDYF